MANTINKTRHEWQAQLTPEQYRVTREAWHRTCFFRGV